MGLLVKKYVEDNCLMGLWEIKEDYEELFSKVRLDEEETKKLNGFLNDQRKLEWLSVRALIKQLLDHEIRIVYNEDNKPFLQDRSYNISISHSNKLTGILVSKKKKLGIDMEYMTSKIYNIEHKYINEYEYITNDPGKRLIQLYVHWCAKEALYKICDKQEINFKRNLIIEPFEVYNEGRIYGTVDNIFGVEKYALHYEIQNNYTIVWCVK